MRRLLLPAVLVAACSAPADIRSPERLAQGACILLPGIFGDTPRYGDLVAGLDAGGYRGGVILHDWTDSALLWPANLRAEGRNRRKAGEIAARVVAYQDAHPGREVYLIGHSGGAGMVVFVLEALRGDRQVTGAVLLGAALGRSYDLGKALPHVRRGLWNFHSPEDEAYLGAWTSILGAADGERGRAAGNAGFEEPAGCDAAARGLYRARLRQRPLSEAMRAAGHEGGHWEWLEREFVRRFIAPIVRGGE